MKSFVLIVTPFQHFWFFKNKIQGDSEDKSSWTKTFYFKKVKNETFPFFQNFFKVFYLAETIQQNQHKFATHFGESKSAFFTNK